MGTQSTTGLTWADLQRFPEDDHVRREIIDGELFVTVSPRPEHQVVSMRIGIAFIKWLDEAGGLVFTNDVDVVIDDHNVVIPDVQVFMPQHVDRVGQRYVEGPPDLAVEVSSPSTKGRDRIRKRALYERYGVTEFWIVDMDSDVIEVYRLGDDGYGPPERFGPGDTVTTALIEGFAEPFERLVPRLDD